MDWGFVEHSSTQNRFPIVASPSGIEEQMADETKNGKNGNQASLLVKVKAGIKERPVT